MSGARDSGVLDALLEHGLDLRSRRVYLHGMLGAEDDVVERTVTRGLHLLDRSTGVIELWICSNGGATDEMFALYDVIRGLENKVTTVGFGHIASAACLLLVAGDRRLCTPNAYFMSHDDHWDLEGEREQHRVSLRIADRQAARWNELMGARTKKSAKWWADTTRTKRELWLDAKQMLAHGIVDEIREEPV